MNDNTYELVDMHCQQCKSKVPSPSSFRTSKHARLYMITGLCQVCQDLEARKHERLRDMEY